MGRIAAPRPPAKPWERLTFLGSVSSGDRESGAGAGEFVAGLRFVPFVFAKNIFGRMWLRGGKLLRLENGWLICKELLARKVKAWVVKYRDSK
jgi:hypothetical protein